MASISSIPRRGERSQQRGNPGVIPHHHRTDPSESGFVHCGHRRICASSGCALKARPLRIESEDGLYHVINRGNYRAALFRAERTKAAFLKCLGQACEKSGWRVHAWCLMSNHFHLLVEGTPRGNLVESIQ